MRKFLARVFLLMLITLPAFGAEPAGEVVDFSGRSLITSGKKAPAPPKFKQSIYLGDTIQTKSNGSVKILFHDDTLLTVKENSKAIISDFLFEPEARKRKTVFNVVSGKIRTVVGRFFGESEQVKIKTPNAVAGIRGTDAAASVTFDATKFFCFSGTFDAYNVNDPEKPTKLTEGTYTEILKDKPPTKISPIPNPEELQKSYDISMGATSSVVTKLTSSEQTTTVSAGTQVVEDARNEGSSSSTTPTPTPTQTTSTTVAAPVNVTLFYTSTGSTNMYFNNNPASVATSGIEVAPGGGATVDAAAADQSSIVITFPQ
ncbi:MAG: FecR family protein [Deltaproteobacteria bacterium]|nr:FecR family protein [Deltaproteobacteria bacterium]